MRNLRLGALGVSLAILNAHCAPSEEQSLWTPGGRYELSLVVTERIHTRPIQSPQSPQISDTSNVLLQLDSVRGDSLFGTYRADFRRFAIRVGRVTPGPQLFVGRMRFDSVWLELTPEATDAGLLIAGSLARDGATGVWATETSSASGQFYLRPADQ
jgi:hypothetical protein